MRSTFMGLETARRGMFTQQGALYVTGHNISNANTPGFSRQRVNFEQTNPFPAIGLNSPKIPGQMGTGVQTGSIQRIRDSFLDAQFREENKSLGYWSSQSEALSRMEDIINEPSDEGLASVLNQLWTSLSDLSVHPEDPGARSVVRQRGIAVAETFNYVSNRLSAIREDIGKKLETSQLEVNSLLKQIQGINDEIGNVEPHGYIPNDLYDQRDKLVDQLSNLVNIKVTTVPSGGNAQKIAEGKYTIQLMGKSGQALGTLVDGKNNFINEFSITKNAEGYVDKIVIGKSPHDVNHDFAKMNAEDNGSISSLIRSYGYVEISPGPPPTSTQKGIYPEKLNELDLMAYKFAEKFNEVHESGWSINDIRNGVNAGDSFYEYASPYPLSTVVGEEHKGAAKHLKIGLKIEDSLDNIAAAATNSAISINGSFNFSSYPTAKKFEVDSAGVIRLLDSTGTQIGTTVTQAQIGLTINNFPTAPVTVLIPESGFFQNAYVGDGKNAQNLAEVKDAQLQFRTDYSTNVMSFFQGLTGNLGTDAAEANRRLANSETLLGTIQYNRDSVSSVSLDEEMSNMVKFQHAYNASARNITAIDEMLDKIINGMGVVGR